MWHIQRFNSHILQMCEENKTPLSQGLISAYPRASIPQEKQLRNGGDCRGRRKNLDAKQSSQNSSVP